MKLSEVKAGQRGTILSVGGKEDFQRRITAVGIIPGGAFEVVRNDRKYPVLLDVRSTVLAVNRKDCDAVLVEVNHE